MASSLQLLCTCLRTAKTSFNSLFSLPTPLRLENDLPSITSIRTATKMVAGSTRKQNTARKQKGKRYGPKVLPDELVQPGAILFRQKGFRMHPGRNVDYGKDHTLYALREGHVKITKELIERPPNCEWGEGPYFERTFIHVEERPYARKIVCQNPEVLREIQRLT